MVSCFRWRNTHRPFHSSHPKLWPWFRIVSSQNNPKRERARPLWRYSVGTGSEGVLPPFFLMVETKNARRKSPRNSRRALFPFPSGSGQFRLISPRKSIRSTLAKLVWGWRFVLPQQSRNDVKLPKNQEIKSILYSHFRPSSLKSGHSTQNRKSLQNSGFSVGFGDKILEDPQRRKLSAVSRIKPFYCR